MKRMILLLSALLAIGAPAISSRAQNEKPAAKAATPPEDAKKLLEAAQKRAAKEKKAVFVLFDASW